MAENINPHNPGVGHEGSDVNIWAVGKFGIALVIVVLFSVGLLLGVFRFFNTRDDRQATTVNPGRIFPQPQLVPNEPKNLADYQSYEDKVLKGYGWVDQQKGVVRIPVDQAIDMLVKRGLPTRQQPASETTAVSMPTESGLGVRK